MYSVNSLFQNFIIKEKHSQQNVTADYLLDNFIKNIKSNGGYSNKKIKVE